MCRQLIAFVLFGLGVNVIGQERPGERRGAPAEDRGWEDREHQDNWKIDDEGAAPGIGTKIALYLPNRVADFADIFTFQFGFGFGLHLNAHATRALQAGGGGSATTRMGFNGRHGGICNDAKAELSVLPLSAEYFKRQNAFGMFPEYRLPEDAPMLYRRYRDYTGVGAELTAILLNAGFEVRPREAVDFLLGFVGIDFRHDDYPRASTGERLVMLKPESHRQIKRVVVVPSRIAKAPTVKLGRESGIAVYYNRRPLETSMGQLGGLFAAGSDKRSEQEFNANLQRMGFDIHRELVQAAERVLMVNCGWDVPDVGETLSDFNDHAVVKRNRGQHIVRLPDYGALAEFYGADAVLDVRVWEWAVWRQKGSASACIRLDCEYKLIQFPQNRVVFNGRFRWSPEKKSSLDLLDYAKNQGENVVLESKQACEVVQAQFQDAMVEMR